MTAPGPVTLGHAADAYLETLKAPNTRRAYGEALRLMRQRFGDGTPLAALGMQDVNDWIDAQWDGSPPETRQARRRAIGSAAAWWAGQDWITWNLRAPAKRQWPSRKGAEPWNKGRKLPPETLTPAEVQQLISAIPADGAVGIRNRAIVTMLYRSGLRISEILAIRPGDVNMAAHSIRLLDTKSDRAQTRGFHPSADDALLRWLDTRKALGIGNHDRKLFCTTDGRPLQDSSVRRTFARAAARAGISKRVHPHGLRHTFAAELEALGVPVSTISKLLGHSGVGVTATYLDGLTNHQAVAALADVELPGLGSSSEEDKDSGEDGKDTANADLAAIRDILANPEAVAALAKIARSAAERRARRQGEKEQGQ
jgi:integrase/recombinase XerD